MITKQAIEEAPPFTVFEGPAEPTALKDWDLFHGFDVRDDIDELLEKLGLETSREEPERDDDATEGTEFTDEDACLAYLNQGGILCKVPDAEGSRYYRLLAVYRLPPRKFVRVRTVMWSDLEIETGDEALVSGKVTDIGVLGLAMRATYFETSVERISDEPLEPEEH